MAKTFDAPLQTSLVPAIAAGSSTPTFTRATAATIIDHEGIVRTCISGEARFYGARRVRNYVSPSVVSENGVGGWGVYGGTYSVTTGIDDPHGGTDARRVTMLTGAADTGFLCHVTGYPYYANGSSGMASAWFRVPSGTLTIKFYSQGTDGIHTDLVVDTTWRRYAGTLHDDSAKAIFWICAMPNGAGDVIDVFEPQLEEVTGQSNQAPGEYVSVGVLSAPYHGAGVDGVRYFATENGNSVASNVVTEATGDAIADDTLRGYLSESQRTNRCLYSEDFTDAAWVKTACTISADSTAAPNGATTADTLTATGPNATVVQDLGVVGSAKKTGSIYLKRKTGTGNIDLTMDGGAGWTTVAVTSSWTRFDLSQTLANEDFGIRIVTSGDEVYAWGAQVEQDAVSGTISWASSYIPTTTAAVTRNRDQLGFAQAGNISALNGTSFCEFYAYSDTRYNSRAIGSDNNSQLTINGLVSIYDGVNSSVAWPATDTILKGASTWADGGNKQAFCNGGGSTPNAFSGFTIPALYIGGTGNDQSASTPIRNIRIWDRVMDVDANGNVISAGGVWRRRGLRAR